MRRSSKDVFDLFKDVKFETGAKNWQWNLTGHQYNPRKTCANIHVIGCDHTTFHHNGKGKGTLQVINCKRLGCPKCYETIASLKSLTILTRIASYHLGQYNTEDIAKEITQNHKYEPKQVAKQAIIQYLEKSIKKTRQKVKHMIASPPQHPDAWKTHKDFNNNRKTAYKILKQCGIQGGVLIPHPYRLKCADCGYKPIPDHRQECPNCHSDRFIWYFSPHFHIVGYGWVTNTTQNYKKNQWVIKNLGIRESIYSTTQYLLSHAGCNRGTLTINWFGNLSRQKLGKTPKLPKIHQHCNECQTAYTQLQWMHTDRPPPKHTFNLNGENAFEFNIGEYTQKTKL